MRLPLRLLEQVTGKTLSADAVAKHLERVGFPVEEIIELLPYDPEILTAQITGRLKDTDDGAYFTAATRDERYIVYCHTDVMPESIVAIAFIKSPLARDALAGRPDAAALVLIEKDIGLEDERPIILPHDTPLGVQLCDVIESTVLDVEITPNRGDLYSLYGLARELCVLWGKPFSAPAPPPVDVTRAEHPFKLSIEAEDDVHQYYGFVIDGVRVAQSPFWLRWILHAFGARPVNNIVDISNYVTFLTGQPLHAFDSSRIRSSHVKVRRANPGERFTAIDHKEYKLSADCLLIADANHPLALAGVMGGEDSEVSENTTGLFLESAEFTQQAARQSIGNTGLTSESSKRFAAGVDGVMVRNAAMVFMDTLAEICSDLVVKGELAYGAPQKKGQVCMGLSKLNSYAAQEMDTDQARKNLELIGFEVEIGPDSLTAKTPSHRNDIAEDVDIIEEVLRLSGYDDLPSRFQVRVEVRGRRHPFSKLLDAIRDFLSGAGFKEVYSLSLIPRSDAPAQMQNSVVPINNPLSERMSVLRPSLLSSMLAVAANNIRFGNTDLSLYEVGHVFRAGDGSIPEATHLGILISGNIAPLRWDQGARAVDFFDLKGVVETFLERFGVGGALFDASGPGYFGDEASSVAINGVSTMEFGKVSIEFLKQFDIAQEVYFCEVNLEAFETSTQGELVFERLPRFGAISRDMALLLDASYSAADVAQFVRSQAGSLCSGIDVFDSFVGDPLPPGKRNLGLRLYFMPRDRNLSKEELDGIMAKAAQRVTAQFNVTVRGREGDGS